MTNLAISGVCDLGCPFCFAGGHLAASRDQGSAYVDAAVFERWLDLLERSGIPEARLIGGEPTLHPAFADLVARAQRRGLAVHVFTHGLMPERALDCLAALPVEACSVLVNMNAGRSPDPSPRQLARRQMTMRRLGQRAIPGFTIYRPDFDLAGLLPIISETGCNPVIRLGLAQPMVDGGNAYLRPKQYPAVGARIAEFAVDAAAVGVSLQFDCGFVRCMFSDEAFEALRCAGGEIDCHCSPILDIDFSGMAAHCFPLTGIVQATVSDGSVAQELRELLARRVAPYRIAGIYPHCSSCPEKAAGACTGGCVAATMRRFRSDSFRAAVPAAPERG